MSSRSHSLYYMHSNMHSMHICIRHANYTFPSSISTFFYCIRPFRVFYEDGFHYQLVPSFPCSKPVYRCSVLIVLVVPAMCAIVRTQSPHHRQIQLYTMKINNDHYSVCPNFAIDVFFVVVIIISSGGFFCCMCRLNHNLYGYWRLCKHMSTISDACFSI